MDLSSLGDYLVHPDCSAFAKDALQATGPGVAAWDAESKGLTEAGQVFGIKSKPVTDNPWNH